MRKTSITLHAFDALRARGEARKMLVVAPKKVCQLVWRQEAAKWSDFRHLRFAFLHGTKKAKLLADDADVHLINPEGVDWLAKQYANNPAAWPYDTVVFDEITKFKNSQSDRSKALRGKTVQGRKLPNLMARAQRRWGATGTPNPNGYLDLFGQFLLLDDGAALGRFVTHYRDAYFSVGFNGFDYELQPGGERRIQARLEPYVFSLSADDYLTLPELLDDIIEIDLEPPARAAYDAMRKDMVAALPEGTVEAANTAAAYTKLSQMAGGAVYMADGSVQEIHTAKLDALSDLIDELQGQQMLIGYEFEHEKARLKARFGDRIAFLSDARTAAAAEEMQREWNAGRLQLLAAHPASAGHGLNLQESDAHHVCWFGPIWDLELWDQFVRRLLRSGNTAKSIMRHILVVRHSIDELKLQALAEKDTSQSRLKRALVTVLGGVETEFRSQDMVMKLQRAGASAPAETEQRRVPAGWGAPKGEVAQPIAPQEVAQAAPAAEERKAPAGWGRPAGAAPTAEQAQREEIREKLNPATETQVLAETTSADRAFAAAPAEQTQAFSAEVIALKSAIETGNEPAPADDNPLPDPQTAKATRTRRTSDPTPPASGLSIGDIQDAVRQVMHDPRAVPTEADAERQAIAEARWAQDHESGQLAHIMSAAKSAGAAVAALSALNLDAAGEAYTLLFGAIEKRLAALGYAEAA